MQIRKENKKLKHEIKKEHRINESLIEEVHKGKHWN